MDSQVAKKPRIAISNAQRKALRTWYHDPATSFGRKKTLADTITWWHSTYGYKISASTASDILSSKYEYLDKNDSKIGAQTKRERVGRWKVLEEALGEWAIRFDTQHGTVSGDLLRLKATELWSKLDEYQGQPCPSWSEGWLTGFKSRFNFRRRRKVGEAASVLITDDITAQMDHIRTIKGGYQSKDVYNMDETGFCWKRLPIAGLTTSSVGKKVDKTRITVNFCCNEDGTDKLPLWFIGTAKRPQCFARNHISNPDNLGIFWRHNRTAWMNHTLMIEWLRWFDQRAKRQVLLLMDNFSAHELAVDLIAESGRPLKWTQIEWFPANTTCIYQPLDQGIIQNWKCFVKKELLLFLKDEFDSGRDFTQTHHVLRAIRWGIKAWELVKIETITKCWNKGLRVQNEGSNEGSSNDVWAESLDIIQDIQDTMRIQDLMAIKNFIHPIDERVLDTDEALTDEIIAEFNTNEAEEEAIEVEVAKVSVVEAITALKTLKLYQEQRDEPNDQDFMAYLAKGLRDLEVKRVNSQRQTTLQQWFN
jgi:hypothetical protein